MTPISSMVSQWWEQEPEEIKKYKRLAKEAFVYRNERFPKKLINLNKINGVLLQILSRPMNYF
uniref:Uncharacterized protein n=1 Tax=Rhizophagus irregularis (strain DAOM 181602 / DAOM 197198 / MUCL 43194) TaxID=747089 RepID=U9UCM0_RHIID